LELVLKAAPKDAQNNALNWTQITEINETSFILRAFFVLISTWTISRCPPPVAA